MRENDLLIFLIFLENKLVGQKNLKIYRKEKEFNENYVG